MTSRSRRPKGMVLIVVVVVVAMLGLAGMSFVAMMQTEHKSIHLQGEELQLEHLRGSGVELLRAFLDQPPESREEAGGTWDNPRQFREVLVFEDRPAGRSGRFSILPPDDDEDRSASRYGLENESARLNLAVLPLWDQREPGAGRRALMALPGMTDPIADAVLDWIDGDAAPRASGAEAEYYVELGVPYGPRNAPPQCLEELLLVRDVTRELLLGPDDRAAREGDRGGRRPTIGGAGEGGSAPWARLLTVASAERNRSRDGRPRVDLNQDDLGSLHRLLEERFDPDWARFIAAFRQYGPYEGNDPVESETAPPFDPGALAKFRIESPLDLVGAKLRIPSADGTSGKVYASPLAAEAGAMRQYMAKLLDGVTVEDAPVLVGRVNLNLASREVLRAAPGMDDALADQIVAARGARRDDPDRRCAAWPLIDGMVDLAKMKSLLPGLTTGGDVYRARVVGYVEGSRRSLAAEVVIDASRSPPRQVYHKDLRLLRGTGTERLSGNGDWLPHVGGSSTVDRKM